MKINDTIKNLVDNGYGIMQLMAAAEITKKQLVEILETDNTLCTKLKKRFKDVDFIQAVEFKASQTLPSNADTPQLAALKEEATKLGIEFNPNIGAAKLQTRINEFKASQKTE